MNDQPPKPTLDYSTLDPNIHIRIVLGAITTKLIDKGVITFAEAGEMANQINDLCRVAAETSSPKPTVGDFRDHP